MKIVFIGTVQVGYSALNILYQKGYEVALLVTLPPHMAGVTSGYVDFRPLAKKMSSKVHLTTNVNSEKSIRVIQEADPELIIVCGWQRLIGKEILSIPGKKTIGFHSSLLPRYRGRAPVNWAIIMGEKETGVTMFYLDEEADTGDIVGQKRFPIDFLDTCKTVYSKSEKAIGQLLEEYLPMIKADQVERIHNPSRSYPCYPKRTPADGLIDFNRPVVEVYNWIRALTRPYPGAYYFEEQKKIIAWKAMIGKVAAPGYIVRDTADIPITITEWEYQDV